MNCKKMDKLPVNPTLEDIMAVVNGEVYQDFFKESPQRREDGGIDPFTRKGAKVYNDLCYVLRGAAKLAGCGGQEVERIIERLDGIADSED